MKKISTLTLITIFLGLHSLALPAAGAWAILSEGDLEKFVQTFPGMYAEYRHRGLSVNPEQGKVEGVEPLKRDQEVAEILSRNGWGWGFWPKLQTIVRGYSLLKHEAFSQEHGANIQKFVNELKSAKWMTPEQKAELEAFYAGAKKDASARTEAWRTQVHDKDLALIRAAMSELDSTMAEVVKVEWDLAAGNPGARPPATASAPRPAKSPQGSDLTAELRQVLGSTDSPRGRVEKITVIRESGGRVSWSPDGEFILLDRTGKDGYYDIYKMRPDGSDEKCLTCDQRSVLGKGHIGQPSWHPSGEYMVFQAQKKHKQGRWGRDLAATPGFGRHSDLWLMDLAAKRSYRLTNTPEDETSGVLHPHFSHDGKTLTWSEMYGKPKMLEGYGEWKIQVADFALKKGEPVLSNLRSYEPGGEGWYENHGLSPDNRKLLFTATFENKRAFHSNLYHYDPAAEALERLAAEKWNEHASYSPSGKRIVWMSGARNAGGGTDYWCMNPDGSDKVRLTDWNNAALPTHQRRMIVAADSSFSPDGRHLVAYLQVNLATQEGITVLIELEGDWERPGE